MYMYMYIYTRTRSRKHNCMYLQDSLGSKVNVDDLASLIPQGGSGGGGDDEASTASLMSKLLEIQNRLAQLEGETCMYMYMYMQQNTCMSDDLSAQKGSSLRACIKHANYSQPKGM